MRAPVVAVGDGALGCWKAVGEVWPETREPRGWVHRLANGLDKLPKRLQPKATRALHAIMNAATRGDAEAAITAFTAEYQAKYPKAVASLDRDQEKRLTCFDVPAEHGLHWRTTNPVESPFSTVRLRQRVTKGAGSRTKGLVMAYKLLVMAEVCQTQPINMTRCPLGLFRQLRSHPRGGFTREHVMDVNRFSRDDDFADQALGDRLTFCTRALFKVMAQYLATGLGLVNDLWPMKALWPSLRSLPTCLLTLLPRGSEFLTPPLPLTQVEPRGLRGVEHTLVLTLAPLLALEQWRELRRERREVLWCGCRPGLRPWRDHVRMAQHLTQRLPDHGLEPISPHALGVALRRAATNQRRRPCALVVELVVVFADAQLPAAHHPQPALAALDERPQPRPT
jgi:hypothetical protein